ncbi:hypothetical protein HHI36_010072 [Cryptolaemus montrouzieri]|uniref:Survival of motor neuron-related-splicing factor 30 n=1 Tax=Cryptolaemus montrouzieri TaxID=559131 RepID=A0ABD2MHN6_9CUCU
MCCPNLGPGWNISPQGLNLISENNTITDNNILLRNALNADLKEIGLPVLTKELNKSQILQLVLQIQKIRNVSAPKANEESQAAPRMLKLILTDGESYAQAIETLNIPSISREKTPPGSKVLLTNVKIVNGLLLLSQDNTKLLGGKVPHLFEKWELAKSVQHCSRSTVSSDGPPAWVNFGWKISNTGDEFKSSDKQTKEQSKENSEFETLRQGAIAEATTGAIKKVFGGGLKQPVQNISRNDYNKVRNDGGKGFKGKKELKGGKHKEVEDRPQKPSDKVSLFDFLEDKLNITESSTSAKQEINQNHFIKPAFDNRRDNYNNYDKNNFNLNRYPQREYPFSRDGNRRDTNKNDNNFHLNKRQYNENENGQQFNQANKGVNKFIRNEKERLNDSWHYRAPDKFNSVQHSNAQINNLAENLSKVSVNSEFASRSLRQHLNLDTKKPPPSLPNNLQTNQILESNRWNVGDVCLAKYWEDEKFYPAKITAFTDTTYVVQFEGYGNIEEILKADIMPVRGDRGDERRHYKGTLEFRRNPRKFPLS